jgi:putative nucleotidyltransferase with HDIG domain
MATQPLPHLDAGTERRMGEALQRRERTLDARERRGSAVFAVAFLLAAGALVWLGPSPGHAPLALIAVFVAVYVGVARVEFSLGEGHVVPTQLVFVPMLLLLPATLAPLLVALALVASSTLEALRRRSAPQRVLLAIADAWFALGPAVVVAALGAGEPRWSLWPVYLLALAAQFVVDGAATAGRVRLCLGVPARSVLHEIALVYRVDALLAPIGLLAAIAAAGAPAAALLVVPLVSLLAIFAREREARIAHSLELGRAYRGTALLLRDLLEEDDEYTGHHTEDVVELSVRVAEQLGVDEDVQRETELGALLHDIGKIHIPDAIINKPGKLDDAEWAIMKTHTVEGQKMLDQVGGLLGSVGVVVRASHERYDGGGYPDGLAGEAIPLAARIVSACDAFNAMTTTRSYRKALPLSVAVQELRDNAGTQFDPQVVEALLAVVGDPGWEASLAAAPAPSSRPSVPAA